MNKDEEEKLGSTMKELAEPKESVADIRENEGGKGGEKKFEIFDGQAKYK